MFKLTDFSFATIFVFSALAFSSLAPVNCYGQASGLVGQTGEFDGVKIDLSNIDDVSDQRYRIKSDLSRLMNKVKPTFSFNQHQDGENARSFSGGGGGSSSSVTHFDGRPATAVALKIDLPKNSEAVIIDGLKLVDSEGKTHDSFPTSDTHFMVCPKYESDHPDKTIAYFPSTVQIGPEVKSISGKVKITTSAFDEAVFKKPGNKLARKKTKLGTYELKHNNGNEFEVTFPLPKAFRGLMGPPKFGQISDLQKRMFAMQKIPGLLKVDFIGSDGVSYEPQTTGGSGGSSSGSASSNGVSFQNGRQVGRNNRPRRSRSTNKQGESRTMKYTLAPLPEGVEIETIRARVYEPASKEKTVRFTFANTGGSSEKPKYRATYSDR